MKRVLWGIASLAFVAFFCLAERTLTARSQSAAPSQSYKTPGRASFQMSEVGTLAQVTTKSGKEIKTPNEGFSLVYQLLSNSGKEASEPRYAYAIGDSISTRQLYCKVCEAKRATSALTQDGVLKINTNFYLDERGTLFIARFIQNTAKQPVRIVQADLQYTAQLASKEITTRYGAVDLKKISSWQPPANRLNGFMANGFMPSLQFDVPCALCPPHCNQGLSFAPNERKAICAKCVEVEENGKKTVSIMFDPPKTLTVTDPNPPCPDSVIIEPLKNVFGQTFNEQVICLSCPNGLGSKPVVKAFPATNALNRQALIAEQRRQGTCLLSFVVTQQKKNSLTAAAGSSLQASARMAVAPLANVSAASYATILAPQSMAAAFGDQLSASVETASTHPLPTQLAGLSVRMQDSTGREHLAPLLFVAPQQINYLVPADLASGPALVAVVNADGEPLAQGEAMIARVAPALFTAQADGRGLPAAVILRTRADGTHRFDAVARFDETLHRFDAAPVSFDATDEVVYLVLFGTGERFRSSLAAVTARIGGLPVEVTYAGAAPDLAGVDQFNLRLPRTLAGRGEVTIALTVDGHAANPVSVKIQ